VLLKEGSCIARGFMGLLYSRRCYFRPSPTIEVLDDAVAFTGGFFEALR